jgi:hypothetical protein
MPKNVLMCVRCVQANMDEIQDALQRGLFLYVSSSHDFPFRVRFCDVEDATQSHVVTVHIKMEWSFADLCRQVRLLLGRDRVRFMYQASGNLPDIHEMRQLWHYVECNSIVFVSFSASPIHEPTRKKQKDWGVFQSIRRTLWRETQQLNSTGAPVEVACPKSKKD